MMNIQPTERGASLGLMEAEATGNDVHAAPKEILILGVGNVLQGDDGVGIHAVRLLQTLPLPENVEALEGGTIGFELLPMLRQRRKVIIIDAVAMDLTASNEVDFVKRSLTASNEVDFVKRSLTASNEVNFVKRSLKPGTIVRCSADDFILDKIHAWSVHGIGLEELLAHARALKPKPEVVIIGVVPTLPLTVSMNLSRAVKESLSQIVETVLSEACPPTHFPSRLRLAEADVLRRACPPTHFPSRLRLAEADVLRRACPPRR